MTATSRFIGVLAMLLLFAPGLAASQEPAYTDNGFDPRMLDAGVPKVERLQLFSRVMTLANGGQVRAQDLAGTLYWRGPLTPGSPVDQNLDQARSLLANAAVHGDVLAMAKLGELELQAGRTTQAMVWAQMYVRYLHPLESARSRSMERDAYASDLIQRIMDAGGKIDDAVRNDVVAMTTKYDGTIRDGIEAFQQERQNGRTRLIRGPFAADAPENRNLNGVAEYMQAFDASGAPGKAWLLAAYPDPKLDSVLRAYLDQVQANQVEKGAGERYLRIPVVHNARKFKALRATH
jgi:hypothetical protein